MRRNIRNNSDISSWEYIPIEYNPADYASRGLDLNHIDGKSRWFQGPQFLCK